MNISFNELVILSRFQTGRSESFKPPVLAYAAAAAAPQPTFDDKVALESIKSLLQRRLLREERDKTVVLTNEGWAAVLNALPVLETLRAACAMVRY